MSSHTAITTSAAADTELTIETDMPTIENIVPAHVLLGLTKKERKRQDVIQGKLTSYFHYLKKFILRVYSSQKKWISQNYIPYTNYFR